MKHLTREQRYTISKMLSTGETQCKIALYLGVSQATISKEVKRRKFTRAIEDFVILKLTKEQWSPFGTIPDRVSIHSRPCAVDFRERFGDWKLEFNKPADHSRWQLPCKNDALDKTQGSHNQSHRRTRRMCGKKRTGTRDNK
jgi:IS30 family transposase